MKVLFLFLLLIFVSCTMQKNDAEKTLSEEKFPSVDLNKFDTIKYKNEFQLLVPDFVTEVRTTTNLGVIEFNHLSKEYHIYVEKTSCSSFEKSLKARAMTSKSSMHSFVKEFRQEFKDRMKSSVCSDVSESRVNNMECHRFDIEGSTFGVPVPTTYHVRCFKGKKNFYTLVCWTVSKNAKTFEKEMLATGLSFKEIS